MGHGNVADEIKGRAAQAGRRAAGGDRRDRGGGRDVPLLPRRLEALHGPGDVDGGAGRARLGHRARVRRVHAVPRHAASTPRARPSAPTAGSDRCLDWHAEHGPDGAARLRDRAGRRVRGPAARVGAGGRRAAGRRDRDRRLARRGQAADARGRRDGRPACCDEDTPRHLLGIGDVDDLIRGVELGIDTFDCAMPTRLGRHGMAIVPDPGARWRVDLAKARFARRATSRSWRAARARRARPATRAATCATSSRPAS